MVLWSSGWSFLLVALFYGLTDMPGWRAWAYPFVAIGANAIFVPAAYGGLGMSYRLYLAVVRIIAEACASTGIIYSTTFNGLKSLIARLGTQDFPRVRMGIAPDHPIQDTARFVLQPFPRGAREELDRMLWRAADAVEAILSEGIDRAMALFNE